MIFQKRGLAGNAVSRNMIYEFITTLNSSAQRSLESDSRGAKQISKCHLRLYFTDEKPNKEFSFARGTKFACLKIIKRRVLPLSLASSFALSNLVSKFKAEREKRGRERGRREERGRERS